MTLTDVVKPHRLLRAGQKGCKENSQARSILAIKQTTANDKLPHRMNAKWRRTRKARKSFYPLFMEAEATIQSFLSFCTITTCFRNQRVCSNCNASHHWLRSPKTLVSIVATHVVLCDLKSEAPRKSTCSIRINLVLV
jgi:hypothetical protein